MLFDSRNPFILSFSCVNCINSSIESGTSYKCESYGQKNPEESSSSINYSLAVVVNCCYVANHLRTLYFKKVIIFKFFIGMQIGQNLTDLHQAQVGGSASPEGAGAVLLLTAGLRVSWVSVLYICSFWGTGHRNSCYSKETLFMVEVQENIWGQIWYVVTSAHMLLTKTNHVINLKVKGQENLLCPGNGKDAKKSGELASTI